MAGAAAAVLAISRQLEGLNRRLLLLGVIWAACALVPPILFFQRIGENVFAERYLYLPFLGLCLATAAALSPLLRRQPWPTLAALGLLASLGGWRVRERTPVWHDQVAFYEDVMRQSPKAPLWQSLGDAYAEAGRLEDAVGAYRTMLVSWPGSYETYSNLGIALYRLGRLDEAVAAYRSSLSIEPNEVAFSNLGIVLYMQGRFEDAIRAFSDAVTLRPTSRAYHNLATTYYLGLHRLPEAATAYEAALRLDPENEESRKALDLLREESQSPRPQ